MHQNRPALIGADRAPTDTSEHQPTALLEIHDLSVSYRQRAAGAHKAVDSVSLAIPEGETVGLVGESGSGKTTIGRAILGLAPITGGSILYRGQETSRLKRRERRALSHEIQVVFQDPYGSLNPTRTIGQSLTEMLRSLPKADRPDARERVDLLLTKVGLAPEAAHRYPSHFSGGQRQRIAIARALMVNPRLVICDEAVSALDLSVQAQVLNLLRDLQQEFDLSYLFISHDLAVVRHVSHRVVVLNDGRVMEEGPAEQIYTQPRHPYTRALLDAAPVPDPEVQAAKRRASMANAPGLSPARTAHDRGCPFVPRCLHSIDECHEHVPGLEGTGDGSVACHRWRELDLVPDTPHPSAQPVSQVSRL